MPHCVPTKETDKDKEVSAITRKQRELGGRWVRIWEKSRTDEDQQR